MNILEDTPPTSTVPRTPTWQIVIRWVGVLPAAILGMVMAGLLMMLFNWLGSSRFGDDSWFTYIWQNGIKAGVEGAAFVFAGSSTAPAAQHITGVVLAGILLFLSGAVFFVGLANREWMNIWQLIATNVGAIATAVHVWNESEH